MKGIDIGLERTLFRSDSSANTCTQQCEVAGTCDGYSLSIYFHFDSELGHSGLTSIG
jgi:hypothetical protein